jgi:hypothetical protein
LEEGAGSDHGSGDQEESELDSFLIERIRSSPGVRFGAIVRAASAERKVPRSTTARHLSRLLRYGDVTLLPDRGYHIGELSSTSGRALLEVRWYDVVAFVLPDGSARMVSQEEWRVVSGQLSHIEFNHPVPPRQFLVWSTAPGRIARIPAIRAPSRLSMDRVDFTTPLTARRSTWQRVCVNVEWPAWYRMARSPAASGGRPTRSEPSREFQSIQVPSQGLRFGRRLTSDAQLRLQVVFPAGYPIGPARSRVLFQTEPDRNDPAEEGRLAGLANDEVRRDGLRRSGTTLALSVPRPLVDRHYTIEWALPTAAERRGWLATQRKRIAR